MTDSHRIPVTDQADVATIHHPAGGDRWLVFCHGFLSDKSGSYERRCRRAVAEGYDAIRFDFRGCGDSDGTFLDQTLTHKLDDLAAVLAYFDPGSYALFGSSFGGKVAFHAAVTDDRVEAVATRAPVTKNCAFASYRERVKREGVCEFPDGRRIDGRFFDDLDEYPFEAVADTLSCPVAMVHGGDDESVPIEHSFAAAQTLDTDVLIEKVAGEGHRFSADAERRMRDLLFEWLDRWA